MASPANRPTSTPDPRALLADLLRDAPCPACGDHLAVPFYDGGTQPLATLAWPRTPEDAKQMEQLPLSFVRCVGCGHVFNEDFEYDKVPYSDKPNLMFNRGALWQNHIATVCDRILSRLPERPVVVEIGCGDGHLLRALADRRPDGRYLGYDLNGQITCAGGAVEAYPSLFDPRVHIAEHRPDLIISRHLLEHLVDPLGFVQQIDFAVAWEELDTRLLLEVPCIDRVFDTGRTADFFYEHNSHFTSESFRRLLARTTAEIEFVELSYDDEVVFGMARLGRSDERIRLASEALQFRDVARDGDRKVRQCLDALSVQGVKVAIWGGTGKAAAFINRNGLDADRFPVVVDSDIDKVGTYVPGTGQRILSPRVLQHDPPEVIVIATQWRARDIALEIQSTGIPYHRVLLENRGELVDYYTGDHPYRATQLEFPTGARQ